MVAVEPAVLHGILALSAVHKDIVYSAGGRSDKNLERFSLQHYNKAIGHVQLQLSPLQSSYDVPLVVSTLFVQMEFLRGHYKSGMMHLRHALNLLQKNELSGARSREQTICLYPGHGWIVTILSRLLVQAKLLGQDIPNPFDLYGDLDGGQTAGSFISSHQARRKFDNLLLRIIELQEQFTHTCASPHEKQEAHSNSARSIIRQDLEQWDILNMATIAIKSQSINPRELFPYRILQLHHLMASTMLDACGNDDEMRFDLYTHKFSAIISHCVKTHKIVLIDKLADTLHPQAIRGLRSDSVSDVGWIAPLYYTAIKCRNRRLRLHAIRLLESVHHNESIWNTDLAAAIGRRVMQLEEEQDLGKIQKPVDDFDITVEPKDADLRSPTAPASQRFAKVEVDLPDDPTGTLVLKCRRTTSADFLLITKYGLMSRQWSSIKISKSTSVRRGVY